MNHDVPVRGVIQKLYDRQLVINQGLSALDWVPSIQARGKRLIRLFREQKKLGSTPRRLTGESTGR